MYREHEDYERIVEVITDIYDDYGICSFPIDARTICLKLGVLLIPYSSLEGEMLELSKKKSHDGYYLVNTIFYNDTADISSPYRVDFTLLHELKHYIFGDIVDNDYNDDMADYFAKYFKCPIPYLIKTGISSVFEIISGFGVSQMVADNVWRNICNRRAKYNDGIFPNEVRILKCILGNDFDEEGCNIIKND